MLYNELTATVKRNLHKCRCSICNQPITEADSIQFLKYRCGRRMNYSFFHTSCLQKAREEINKGRV